MSALTVFLLLNAFFLFLAGHTLIRSAALHTLGPAMLVRRGVWNAVRAGFAAGTLTGSQSTAWGIALAHDATGALTVRECACFALSGCILLPCGAMLPPEAGAVMLIGGFALMILGNDTARLWGRALAGLALYATGAWLLGRRGALGDMQALPVLQTLFGPGLGFVIMACLAFLSGSAAAVGGFACCLQAVSGPGLAALFAGCLAGESLRCVLEAERGREQRFSLMLFACRLAGSLVAWAAAWALSGAILEKWAAPVGGAALYAVFILIANLASLILAGFFPFFLPEKSTHDGMRYFSPRLAYLTPCALTPLRLESMTLIRDTREAALGAADALMGERGTDLKRLEALQEKDRALIGTLKEGLNDLKRHNMTGAERREMIKMTHALDGMERLTAHAEHLVALAGQAEEWPPVFGKGAGRHIYMARQTVLEALDAALKALAQEKAPEDDPEQDIRKLGEEAALKIAKRVQRGRCDPETGQLAASLFTELEGIMACCDAIVKIYA